MHEKIIILDFGGQYAHLIASRIRREKVLSEIYNPDEISVEDIKSQNIKGIILSGGPQSVFATDSPQCNPAIFELGIPVLGICYGHQFLNHSLGGIVSPGKIKEYGRAELTQTQNCPLFKNIPEKSVFWMSHGDEVTKLANGFEIIGTTKDCSNAAVWHPQKNLFGIQFHPEVTHSEFGDVLLKNFIDICEVSGDWTIEKYLAEHSKNLKAKIGAKKVFIFVSGGVDSTVCFALLSKVLGADKIWGLFVDNGLLRKDEVAYVEASLQKIGANLTTLKEADRFLENLAGITDPEKKRAVIGNTFLDVQRDYFAKHKITEGTLLAQGTIYPDTIESGATKNASKIKTHHNRVPEIQKMIDAGLVIEPLVDLYKDEVRNLGRILGLPEELVNRHPFPGPGLGVRTLCSPETIISRDLEIINDHHIILPIKSVGVQGDARTYRHPAIILNEDFEIPALEKFSTELINSEEKINRSIICIEKRSQAEKFSTISVKKSDINPTRIKLLQEADHIVMRNLELQNLYQKVWQFPVVICPMSFNDEGEESIILRPINSIDAMSASVGNLPWEFFTSCAEEILMKIPEISAVFLDITSKPPGTIEWE